MRQRLPLPYGQRIDRNRPVSEQFDGRDLPAFDGDSVASAIVAVYVACMRVIEMATGQTLLPLDLEAEH